MQNQAISPTPLPFVVAHRGASGNAPENTLAAIRHAAELGCGWVEVDGTVTADARAVLHHDDQLDRCSDGSGLLLAQRLETLRTLDFGQWFDDRFLGERIPTVAECGLLCEELHLGCNLEIKVVDGWEEPTALAVCESVRNHWPKSTPLLFSSFNQAALLVAKQLLPQVPRAYLATVIPQEWQYVLEYTGSSALHCGDNACLRRSVIQKVIEAGYPVRVYTVDDPQRAAELKDWGVEAIFTNYPERMTGLGA